MRICYIYKETMKDNQQMTNITYKRTNFWETLSKAKAMWRKIPLPSFLSNTFVTPLH
jgi:hypothetical protein